MSPQEKCLLLGFGDIAKRLSKHLLTHYQMTGVRRRQDTAEGVELLAADCSDIHQLQPIVQTGFDVIVVTMTPSEMSDQGYCRAYVQVVETLLEALENSAHKPRLILFASSSSVYGQAQGEWVNEHSPTAPTNFSGKRLLQAEQCLMNSPYSSCIVRFSGIYGPGRRRLIDQVLLGHATPSEPLIYSNRIHSEDCAGVLAHLIEQHKTQAIEPIYLASDCQPAPLYEVKQWLAEQLNAHPRSSTLTPTNRSLRSNKRCSNQRLLDGGYQFLYPNYQAGYRALLSEMDLSS